MPELSLDDVERDAFAREFDGVGMAELVRGKPPSESRLDSEPTQLGANRRA